MTAWTVGLVACGARKIDRLAPARDLYTGNLFRAASSYAAATYDEWWILSAKHGLVHPDTPLDPYNIKLTDLSADRRRGWAHVVESDLREPSSSITPRPGLAERFTAGQQVHVFFHAGTAYRELLAPLIARWSNTTIHRPLDGLAIGEQLRWYGNRNRPT